MSNILRPITEFDPEREAEVAAAEIHDNLRRFQRGLVPEGERSRGFIAYFPVGISDDATNRYHQLTEQFF